MVAAALVVAACFPSLEGAPCNSDLNCPREQTCAAGRCVARCTLRCGEGLVCGLRGGEPACECDPHDGPSFHVSATEGSRPQAAPFPNGRATPAQCHFSSVTEALAAAAPTATAERPATVLLVDQGVPSEYRAESFPLRIPPFVTVTSGPSPTGQHVVTVAPAPGAGELDPAVSVAANGAIEGLVFRRSAPGGTGLELVCQGPPGERRATRVRFEGPFAVGVRLGCGAEVRELSVDGAQTGLTVNAPPAEPISVRQARIVNADGGVVVTSGAVLLEDLQIQRHGVQALFARPQHGNVAVTVDGGSISEGQGNGIVTARVLTSDLGGQLQVSARALEVVRNGGSGILHQAGTLTYEGGSVSQHTAPGASGVRVSGLAQATLRDLQLVGNRVNLRVTDSAAVTMERGASRQATERAVDVGGATAGTPPASVVILDAPLDSAGAGALRVTHAEATVRGAAVIQAAAGLGVACERGRVAVEELDGRRPQLTGSLSGALRSENCVVRLVGAVIEANRGGSAGAAPPATLALSDPGSATGHRVELRDCVVRGDATGGTLLSVTDKPALPGGERSLEVENCQFAGGQTGIALGGVVAGRLHRNSISGAARTGVTINTVASPAPLAFTSNEVTGNTTSSTAPDAAGGVLLEGPGPTGFEFTGNRVSGNGKAQLTVRGTGTWDLSAASCQSRNIITCYASGWPGLIVNGPALSAINNSWLNSPPQPADDLLNRPNDYRRINGGTFPPETRVTPSCEAVPCR